MTYDIIWPSQRFWNRDGRYYCTWSEEQLSDILKVHRQPIVISWFKIPQILGYSLFTVSEVGSESCDSVWPL